MEKYWLWLVMAFGIGENGVNELLERFGNAEAVYNAFKSNISAAGKEMTDKAESVSLSDAEKLQKELSDSRITIITREDKDYPARLLLMDNPPNVLFARGNTKILNNKTLTLTGSRKITDYTLSAQRKVLNELSSEYTFVTTLSYGCDQFSCLCALKSDKPVIEILVAGHDFEHPAGSHVLREEIIAGGGCVITEYLPNTKATAFQYMRRAKLLGAFSPATLVFQAGMGSGALKIASFSDAPFVLPPYDVFSPDYAGAVYAVRNGVSLFYEKCDLDAPYSEDYTPAAPKLKVPKNKKQNSKNDEKKRKEPEAEIKSETKSYSEADFESKYHFAVFSVISDSDEPVAFDIILHKTEVDITELSEILLDLEIEGLIKAQPGNRFSKNI